MLTKIGRKLYYDIFTGEILVDTGEKEGYAIEKTFEQDVSTYKILSERDLETFDMIKLSFGQYLQDFAECSGYRINIETKEIEFSYPDSNEPETPPVYQKPLSIEVEELKVAQAATDTTLLELMETILI